MAIRALEGSGLSSWVSGWQQMFETWEWGHKTGVRGGKLDASFVNSLCEKGSKLVYSIKKLPSNHKPGPGKPFP